MNTSHHPLNQKWSVPIDNSGKNIRLVWVNRKKEDKSITICFEKNMDNSKGIKLQKLFSDIDECIMNYCDQWCYNSEGSYQCGCNKGYVLSVDKRTCKGKVL